MSKFTEHLIQLAAIVALVFYGYNFAVQTVVSLSRQSQAITQLRTELKQCKELSK